MVKIEEIFFKWIPQVGFPIVVAAYVLIRIEPRLNVLTSCVKDLTSIVSTDSVNTLGVKTAIENLTVEIARMNKGNN